MESIKTKPKGPESEAGFSLIELIIASAVMMILIVATYRAADSFLKSTAAKKSKRVGEQTLSLLSKAVKRDWELRSKDKPTTNVEVSGCASGTSRCKNLNLTRVKADTTGDVTISFQSTCQSTAGDAATSKLLPELNFAKVLQKTLCLKAMACSAGTVPWVTIESSDASANLAYPTALLLGSAAIQAKGPIGLAMCTSKEGSTLKVTLESFYIKTTDLVAGKSQHEIEFSNQEMALVSEQETGGLQLYSTGVEVR